MQFDDHWEDLKHDPAVAREIEAKMRHFALSRIHAEARTYKEAYGFYPDHWFEECNPCDAAAS